MLFNSPEFLLFLPIVFGLCWFVVQRNLRAQNVLLVLVSWNKPPNQWFAHIVRKGSFKHPYGLKTRRHPPRSQYLDNILKTGLEEAAATFNNIRVIVCYDSESYWAYSAALCGCIVVIVPTPVFLKQNSGRNFQF